MLSSTIWDVGRLLYEGEEAVYKLTSSSTAGGGLQRRTRVCTVRPPPSSSADAVRRCDGEGRGLARVRAGPRQLLQEADGVSAPRTKRSMLSATVLNR